MKKLLGLSFFLVSSIVFASTQDKIVDTLVVCDTGSGLDPNSASDKASVALSTHLNTEEGVKLFVYSGTGGLSPYYLIINKPFKVSAPSVSIVSGGRSSFQSSVCVTLTK